MQFVSSIVRFFFRRIDFLNRSIYITVAAFIAELSVFGFKDSLISLTGEIKESPDLEKWQYWGIRLFEVLFIGGDWAILITLALLLIGLITLKYKTRELPSIKHHFNSQLRSIEGLLDNFKPETAFQLLRKFLDDVDDSYLADNDRNELKAWAYHLMGICRVDRSDSAQLPDYHIESYLLQPNNSKYKERACVSYYNSQQLDKALVLANELLNQNSLNERANAIRLICDQNFNEQNISPTVKAGQVFLRICIHHFLFQKNQDTEKVRELLTKYIEKRIVPDAIHRNNLEFWELIGRLMFNFAAIQNQSIFAEQKESYATSSLMGYANLILSKVYALTAHTELFRTSKALRLTIFYYWHSEYLLYGKTESVTEMTNLYNSSFSRESFSDQLYSSILISLNQLKRYQDVLSFAEGLNTKDSYVSAMKYHAYEMLGKVEEAISCFIEYLERLDGVTDIETSNLLEFADFLIQNKKQVEQYYNSYISPVQFSESIYRSLVYSYYHRYESSHSENILKEIDTYKVGYSQLKPELRHAVLVICFVVKQHELAVALIEEFHDWRSEEPALFIYTECLLELKKDSGKLMEVLKRRRATSPQERLFLKEIEIYELLENSLEILNLTRTALSQFPHNAHFKFYLIYALYKLKIGELRSHLNNNLLSIAFNWREKFLLAQICIENGEKVLGLEIFYQEVIKHGANRPMLKQQYFFLTTQIGDRKEIPWPDSIELNTTVKLRVNGEDIFIDVTDISVQENWMVKPILGLKQGETTRLEDTMMRKPIQLEVVAIFDKYSGLAARISDEIRRSNYTGMGIRSIPFEDASIGGINKTLIEHFGEAGDRQKIQKDEALAQYYGGKLSFTELVRRISRDEVLEVYSFLTSKQSNGFVVIPVRHFTGVNINSDSEFVIDFTSLPILMKISESFPGILKHKFVISQFAIELLENEIIEAKNMQEDGLTLSITSFGVLPTPYPPGYKEYRLSTLQKIVDWISSHCEIRFSKEKLDIILEKPDLMRDGDLYFNYFIDTAFICHGRTLISDDRIHNKTFGSHYLTISLEYYLMNQYDEIYHGKFQPILIENHYVGLRVDRESLVREFKRPFYGGVNTFYYCLENLPFSVNNDLTVFNEALDFIKFVYTEDSPLDFRRMTAQQVFVAALRGYPNLGQLKRNLANEIHVRFALLQMYLPMVLEDFEVALNVLRQTNI
ncbi:MAG TPA: hypothetical protein VD884_15190 [Ohtaekwangia sp.]|nr:hypothetical protein [Ohtaekwangia sp.]